jgi:hypothetical protein
MRSGRITLEVSIAGVILSKLCGVLSVGGCDTYGAGITEGSLKSHESLGFQDRTSANVGALGEWQVGLHI